MPILRTRSRACSALAGWASLLALSACGREEAPGSSPAPVTVFAAASLTDVLPKVAEAWKAEGGAPVRFSWGATSKLVPQVLEGAPADALFAADEAWMDKLATGGKVEVGTRQIVATNTLVWIVPAANRDARESTDVLAAPPPKRLALAGENVPAGKYAKAALTALGAWSAMESHVVRAEDVRLALRWVATAEAEAGIVYRTDAAVESKVRVVFAFAPASHPPIVYPAAVVKGSKQAAEARQFLEFCRSAKARALFEAAGFGPPGA